jgi:ATP-dependent DNA helicase Rep
MIECEPSRFLDELPDDVIQREGREEDPEAARAEGEATINSLRSLLQ